MADEIPPEYRYDPTYDFEMPPTGYVIMGLTALSAFAMIGIGAFCTTGAVVAGTATETTFVVNGITYLAPSLEVAEAWAAVDLALATGTAIPAAATDVLTLASAVGTTPSAVALLSFDSLATMVALAAYDVSHDLRLRLRFGNFGQYMGGHISPRMGSGGFGGNPGFPDFPGGGFPMGGGRVCYDIDGTTYCFYTY